MTGRGTQIATVLDPVISVRAAGEPVILLGDFNLTERQPAYRRIVASDTDAEIAAGWGPSNT